MSQRPALLEGYQIAAVSESQLRPSIQGKFLFLGQEKLYIRGVTYGPFPPTPAGCEYHNATVVERDLVQMAAAGFNAIRTYTVPPRWLLDLAHLHGLWVMVGLAWEQHITFLSSRKNTRAIERRVRDGVRACAGHPALLAYAIGNEIPAPIVRWHGPRAVERFLRRLYETAKEADPEGLVTYVNYPTTEYLDLPFLDLASFNVYLESQEQLERYVARLHNVVGERPLLLAELGLDSMRNGEDAQAEAIGWQIETSMRGGCAGAFVFSWTDEWHRGGEEIQDWQFGLTSRERQPKPALEAVRRAFDGAPFGGKTDWPRISVVVCSHNGAQTIAHCCEALRRLDYPDYEVIVVDDGSSDGTRAIAASYGFRVIGVEHEGLSAARNKGLAAATGEIIAYTDDDAYADPHWLRYVALALDDDLKNGYAGVGGPNLLPPGEGLVAECVGSAPGGPVHVLLSDSEAEHIPGVNMAFRRECLEAIGGFDPRFRTAGDDVDVCWRLQERGWKLGFSPAAVVWHHPRRSIRGYWRQQAGYGRAEALLERKWPEKYNVAGHFTWSGRVYDANPHRRGLLRRGRIYQGTWGSAPFQSLYQPVDGGLWSLTLMPEWYLLAAGLAALLALGGFWSPLLLALPLLLLMMALSLIHALHRAHGLCNTANAAFSRGLQTRRERYVRLGLTAFLALIQPLARLSGRLSAGLTLWRRHGAATGDQRNPFWPRGLKLKFRGAQRSLWSEQWYSAQTWLRALESTLRSEDIVVQRGEEFDHWDLEIRTGTFTTLRLLMAIEEHSGGRQLVRFRMWPSLAAHLRWLIVLQAVLAIGAAVAEAWPVSLVLAGLLLVTVARALGETVGAMKSVLLALETIEQATTPRPRISFMEEAREADGAARIFADNGDGHDPVEIPVRLNGHDHDTNLEIIAVSTDREWSRKLISRPVLNAANPTRPADDGLKPNLNQSEGKENGQ